MLELKSFSGAGGGGGGNKPDIESDNLRSRDTVEFVLGISEGRIKGLKDGLKSFFIGDIPLQAPDGSHNFDDFYVALYQGSEEAEPIEPALGGFARASTTVNVQVPSDESNVGEWITRQTTTGDITAIDVRIVVQSLYRQERDGDVRKDEIKLRIEYKPLSSSTWKKFFNKDLVIKGKTTTTYVKEYRQEVKRIDEPYQIRVSQLNSNSTKYIRRCVWESFQEIDNKAFNLSNTAALHVVGRSTDQFSSIPQFYGIYEGLMCRVPSNYNTTTRTYSGTWDGTFKLAWTDDPAWILYEVVMNDRWGWAATNPDIYIDKYDCYAASLWCSERIPTGVGEAVRPRFSFNAVIQEPMQVREFARYIAGSFNAAIVDDFNGTIRLLIDKDDAAVSLFTPESITEGDFEYTYTDLSTWYNDITVIFTNPELNWEVDRRRVYDQTLIDKYGRIEHEFVAVGCTNASEAIMKAKYRLYTATTETEMVSFKTNRRGLYISPFDVILIADPDRGYALTGRITGRSGTTVHFRDPIYLENGVSYKFKINTPTGVIERNITAGTPRGSVTSVILNQSLPANTPENADFSIEAEGVAGMPKPFRVLKVEEGEHSDAVTILAVEINRQKWAILNAKEPGPEIDYSDRRVDDIRPPQNLKIREITKEVYGQQALCLALTWDRSPSPMVRRYVVMYRRDDGPWMQLTNTSELEAEFLNVAAGNYEFEVYAQSLHGRLSKPATASYFIEDMERVVPGLANLRLVGQDGTEFFSPDCAFEWDVIQKDSLFASFEVTIRDTVTNAVRRTFHVQEPRATYFHSWNAADGLKRSFRVEVRQTDIYDNKSPAISEVFHNDPIQLPGIDVMPAIGGIVVWADKPSEPDFAGIRIYMSEESGFTPGPDNLVYDGPDLYWRWEGKGIRYFRVSPYDTFSKDDALMSIQYVEEGRRIVAEDIQEAQIKAIHIAANTIDQTKFADNLKPIGVSNGLPDPATWDGPDTIVNTEDGGLYYLKDGEWITAVPEVDLDDILIENKHIVDGAVDALKLAANAVTSAKIATGAVLADKLADAAVTARAIASEALNATHFAQGLNPVQVVDSLPDPATWDGSNTVVNRQDDGLYYLKDGEWVANAPDVDLDAIIVENKHIVDGAVDALKLAANAVTSAKIATGAVLEDKLADAAVTAGKIAANAISTENLQDELITAEKLVANAVTEAKLAANAVTQQKLANAAVRARHIAQGVIDATKFAAGISAPHIVDALPTTDNFEGRLVVLKTDGKLYRFHAGEWTAAVPTTDLSGLIEGSQLVDEAITAVKLAEEAVEATKIKAGAVLAEKLAEGAVIAGKIAANAISTENLQDELITAEKIVAEAVTRVKIAGEAIDASKLANNAVTTAKVAANAINAGKIASNAVQARQIQANAVTTAKLADEAVQAAKLAANAVTQEKLADAAVTASKIAEGAIEASKFAAGISAPQIVSALPTSGNFEGRIVFLTTDGKLYRYHSGAWTSAVPTADLSGLIQTEQLVDEAITAVKIATDAIDSSKIKDSAITAAKVAANAIEAGKIAANAVNSDQIAANAVTTAKLVNNAVNAAKIAANAVTQAKIANNAVTARQIADGVIGATKFASDIAAPQIVSSLPTSGNYEGRLVVYQGELHRYHNGSWTTAVKAVDVAGQLTNEQIAEIEAAKLTGQITETQISDAAITTPKLAAGSVVSDKVAANAIVAAKIASNAVQTRQIQANAVVAGKIASNAIEARHIVANSITAGAIAAGAVGADQIAANAITSDKIAANAITARELVIGDFTNLIPNGSFDTVAPAGWEDLPSHWSIVPREDAPSPYALRMPIVDGSAHAIRVTGDMPCSPGDQFLLSCVARAEGGEGSSVFQMYARYILSDGSVNSQWGNMGSAPSTGFELMSRVSNAPADAAFVSFWVRRHISSGTGMTVFATNFQARRITPGVLIQDGAITAEKVSANAINANHLAANSVTASQIAANAVTASQLAANAVKAVNIEANAVTTAKIAANAVTTNEIAANAVKAAQIDAGAVTSNKIAANAVVAGKIDTGAVTADTIATNAVTAAKISANAVTAAKIASNAVQARQIQANAVNADKIAANSVGTDHLVANSVTAGIIAAGAVGADQIAANAVRAEAIAANAITASKLAIGDFTNLVPDAMMADDASWTLPAQMSFVDPSIGQTSQRVVKWTYQSGQTSYSGALISSRFPVREDAKYFARVLVTALTNNKGVKVWARIHWYDENLQEVTPNTTIEHPNTTSTSAGQVFELSNTITPRAGAKFARFQIYVDRGVTTGDLHIGSPAFYMQSPAVLIENGAITAEKVSANAINASHIATNSITADHLSANSVTASQLAANAVKAVNIEANAVTTAKIAANAVTTNEIAANAVKAAQIDAGAVTTGALAAGAVTSEKIEANAVTAREIAANAVTATQIAANAVVAATIAANAVTTQKIAANAVTAAKIAANTITAAQIATNTITGDLLVANAITTREIAVGAVTADQIDTNAVTAVKIAANAVTAAKIQANAVVAAKVATNAIESRHVLANNITAAKIASNAIETRHLKADAITAGKIAAGAVGADQIAANAISSDKILAGSITAEKLTIGFGKNLLHNASFTFGLDGWTCSTGGGQSSGDIEFSWRAPGLNWSGLITPVLRIRQAGDDPTGYADVRAERPDTGSGNLRYMVPATAGEWFEASVHVSAHRCQGELRIECRGADGTTTGYIGPDTTTGSGGGANSQHPDNWPRLWVKGQLPAGTVGVGIHIRKRATSTAGANDSVLYIHKPFLARTVPNVTEPSDWSDGGVIQITSGGIVANAVLAEHITANAIQTNHIASGSVVAASIAANAVTTQKLAANAVTAAKIAAGTITGNEIAGRTIAGDKLIANTITADEVATNAIIARHIQANAVTAVKIAANAVTTQKLEANAVTAVKIAANAVTTQKLEANAVVAAKIASNAIEARHLTANSITAGAIAVGAVGADQIAANAISADKIAANAITTEKLAISNFSNLLDDPGFELYEPGSPEDPRSYVLQGPTGGSWSRTAFQGGYARNGYALRYNQEAGTGSTDPNGTVARCRWPDIPVNEGDTFAFSVWVRRAEGAFQNGTVGVRLHWKTITGANNGTPREFVNLADLTGNYQKIEIIRKAPPGTAYVMPEINVFEAVAHPTSQSIVAFDDAFLGKVIGSTLIEDGAVTAEKITANAITGSHISANAIAAVHIAANAVNASSMLADNVVVTRHINANAVTAQKINSNVIETRHIRANQIEAGHIKANAIETGHISSGAVKAEQIAANAITSDKIAANAITAKQIAIGDFENVCKNPQFQDGTADGWDTFPSQWSIISRDPNGPHNAVRTAPTAKFVSIPADGATRTAWVVRDLPIKPGERFYFSVDRAGSGSSPILAAMRLRRIWRDAEGNEVSSANTNFNATSTGWQTFEAEFTTTNTDAVTVDIAIQSLSSSTNTGYFTNLRIYKMTPTVLIEDGAITAEKITANAVTTDKIAAEAITANKIAANAIDTIHLKANSVEANQISANAVTAAKIAANAVNASKIAANAVTADKIAANAVNASKIAANAVTAAKIASNAIQTRHLTAGSIRSQEIAANTIRANNIYGSAVNDTYSTSISSNTYYSATDNDKRTRTHTIGSYTTTSEGQGRIYFWLSSGYSPDGVVAYAQKNSNSTTASAKIWLRAKYGSSSVTLASDSDSMTNTSGASSARANIHGTYGYLSPGKNTTVTFELETETDGGRGQHTHRQNSVRLMILECKR